MKYCFSAIILALSFFALFNACVKEEYDPDKLTLNYAPELAIPLVHAVITVEDLFDQADNPTDELTQDMLGFMTLIYKTSKTTPAANNFITFPGGPLWQPFTNIGVSTPEIADSIDLNLKLFNKITNGSFYFEDPKLQITFQNSFGTPIQMNLTRLEAWSSANGFKLKILMHFFFFKSTASATPGQTATTIYSYDKTNSNISDWVTDAVANRFIYYSAQGIINPTTPSVNSFIIDSSTINMEVRLELPLYGRGEYVVIGDTVPFNMDINEPTGSPVNASEATLVINTYNGFPLEAVMQISFLDSSNSIIDTLFSQDQKEIIMPAAVGPAPDLKVIAPSHKMTEITISKDRLDNWARANRLIITGSLTTSGGGGSLVKVYAGYSLEIKLAARAKLYVE